MKITKLELFKLPPRWLFLKISTDQGLSGWGEPVVEGKAETVKAAVKEMEDYLIGKDPLKIEDIWQTLYRGAFYRGGPVLMSAIAGIDQALWDIKGKYLDQPVYQLLGGKVRDKVRVYSWIGGDRPDNVAQAAKEKNDAGFTAVKMNGTEELHYIDSYKKVDQAVARVAAIRDQLGPDFGIAVDFHGRVHKGMARILFKELEPFRLMFIEEPVLSENIEALATMDTFGIPIALGERLFSRWDYKKVFELNKVDIIQPDLSHAGGISEVRKIAAMAEAYDTAVAPHSPLGPINLAASLQIDAVTPNVFIQEQSLGIHYNQGNDLLDYLVNKEVFKYKAGYAEIPDSPGLGIEIDEDFVRSKAKESHNWKNPVWRNQDGTIAEW
ncbi:galactonate dehydratase [Halanaerobium saccharolyticum]|uniref:Galactonate dehydratase n=1 Tax=Halanaerobium saccharolyticum TaxID=43595 RepID=A0A4R7Z8H1_9FIRM|nr:galactonate dehydratase [Halanaerobium saccharolyticum]RAK09733.1 galactonate dehydratase [Halanaerobium saccharolyticum]TDW07295.1 galactonate dehydratase [Halanaerobium saccharolyticum]TDX61174.1 galactonate dehydratase [Halanaerobium saccharolyticum]